MTLLSEAEVQFGNGQSYIDDLIALAADEAEMVSCGATWLIKSHLERDGMLTTRQVSALVEGLSGIAEWGAQLHICQSVRYLRLNSANATALVLWLAPLLSHKRPFIRAWAVDALCRISIQHSEFLAQARTALDAACADTAASVRARARNIEAEIDL